MSNYLDTADSGSDEDEKVGTVTSPEEKEFALQDCARIKGEGNDHFSKSEFQEALTKYSEALNTLKNANLPKDALILLNRCASYLALKRFVPALNDANQGLTLFFGLVLVSVCHICVLQQLHWTL
jgi:tetratricopeptide (TPR) repeat protein